MKDSSVKNKGGRPKIVIEAAQLKAIMRLNPTLEDVAAFFECSPDTIERVIKREHGGLGFAAFRDQNMVHTRFTLIRTALHQASSGNTAMLIFCLKNLCNWRDKPPDDVTDIQFKNMTTQDLIVLVKKKLEEPKT